MWGKITWRFWFFWLVLDCSTIVGQNKNNHVLWKFPTCISMWKYFKETLFLKKAHVGIFHWILRVKNLPVHKNTVTAIWIQLCYSSLKLKCQSREYVMNPRNRLVYRNQQRISCLSIWESRCYGLMYKQQIELLWFKKKIFLN